MVEVEVAVAVRRRPLLARLYTTVEALGDVHGEVETLKHSCSFPVVYPEARAAPLACALAIASSCLSPISPISPNDQTQGLVQYMSRFWVENPAWKHRGKKCRFFLAQSTF